MSAAATERPGPELGLCQWFHYLDHAALERAVGLLRELGVRHLRTGISWADFHRPEGPAWYREQMEALGGFEVLLSIWHTPPSISENESCSGPPRRLEDFADFVEQVIDEYGDCFAHLELWNEPNNRLKWDFPLCDHDWRKFGAMVRMAGERARARSVPTVLGGMIPVDRHWLALMKGYEVLPAVDVVGIHAFPEMWWPEAPSWDWPSHWQGWEAKVASIEPHTEGRPVWVTETGLATWDLPGRRPGRFDLQMERLERAATAPVDRLYWYCLLDLDPSREAIEGFHVDENEYHMGLVDHEGARKPAWYRMRELLGGG